MAHLIKEEKFNTNNAWGFGGKSGIKKIYSNGVIHESGAYSYRHSGTSKFNNYYLESEGVLFSITKEEAEILICK